jgi:ethanolamine permease
MKNNEAEINLKKALRPIHLWAIAVGLVISGDYFGWNYGFKSGVLEFFVATILVTLFYIAFAFSFTELSTSIPQASGPFAYSKRALGKTGGFIAGFATLMEFLFAAPAIASALGSYLHFLYPEIPALVASISFIVLFTIVNLFGIQQTANFEVIITIIASIGIVVYIIMIYPFSKPLIIFKDLNSFSLESVWRAMPFAIWFYLAVEGVAMAAEETENPKKDIPIGYFLGIGTLVFFALSVLILTSGLDRSEELIKNDHPLAEALKLVYGEESNIPIYFAYFGLIGIMASLLGIIFSYSRQIFGVAREGYLPRFLAKLDQKTGTPRNANIIGGFIGLLGVISGRTDELITLSVMGAIVMYMISMISLFVLRTNEPNMIRPFKAPFYPYLPLFAFMMALVCLLSVVWSNLFISFLFISLFIINYIIFIFTFGKENV